MAGASDAVIIGFNVKADGAAQRLAQKENVEIRYYDIIYKLIDDIQAALTGMLEPTYREVIEGHAEVQQTFKAGYECVVLDDFTGRRRCQSFTQERVTGCVDCRVFEIDLCQFRIDRLGELIR